MYPRVYHEFETPSHLKHRIKRHLVEYVHYVKTDETSVRPIEKMAEKDKVGVARHSLMVPRYGFLPCFLLEQLPVLK
jgi:hypothetical protein